MFVTIISAVQIGLTNKDTESFNEDFEVPEGKSNYLELFLANNVSESRFTCVIVQEGLSVICDRCCRSSTDCQPPPSQKCSSVWMLFVTDVSALSPQRGQKSLPTMLR